MSTSEGLYPGGLTSVDALAAVTESDSEVFRMTLEGITYLATAAVDIKCNPTLFDAVARSNTEYQPDAYTRLQKMQPCKDSKAHRWKLSEDRQCCWQRINSHRHGRLMPAEAL